MLCGKCPFSGNVSVMHNAHISSHHVYLCTKYTHTHNRFTALLEYVRDHPGEQVPER